MYMCVSLSVCMAVSVFTMMHHMSYCSSLETGEEERILSFPFVRRFQDWNLKVSGCRQRMEEKKGADHDEEETEPKEEAITDGSHVHPIPVVLVTGFRPVAVLLEVLPDIAVEEDRRPFAGRPRPHLDVGGHLGEGWYRRPATGHLTIVAAPVAPAVTWPVPMANRLRTGVLSFVGGSAVADAEYWRQINDEDLLRPVWHGLLFHAVEVEDEDGGHHGHRCDGHGTGKVYTWRTKTSVNG